jgi:predicted CXXCH cytochrome family protein
MIVTKSAKFVFFFLLGSVLFAQTDPPDSLLKKDAQEISNPHTEDAECFICHLEASETKEEMSQTLCYKCHSMEEFKNKKYKHSIKNGCLTCHQNHQPAGEPLLKSDPIGICLQCHGAIASKRTHPLEVRDPNTGGPLTCTSSCHDVHGTNFEYLCQMEPGRKLCISCHEEFK